MLVNLVAVKQGLLQTLTACNANISIACVFRNLARKDENLNFTGVCFHAPLKLFPAFPFPLFMILSLNIIIPTGINITSMLQPKRWHQCLLKEHCAFHPLTAVALSVLSHDGWGKTLKAIDCKQWSLLYTDSLWDA